MLVKVPEITAWFWVIKVTSTAMGEALSDFLDGGSGLVLPALGVLLALVVFLLALRAQLRAREYRTGTYWFAVAMVATFGTMAADSLHQALAIPYSVSTALFAGVLATVFWRWHASEGTLSIHSIDTERRERYYWATVLTTFALGTAAGDMTATDLNLGFLTSGILFTVAIAVPALGWWRLRWNPVVSFWVAYVLTRPLGASFADWLDVGHHRGVGLGTGPVSASLAVLMVALVAFVGVTGRDAQPGAAPARTFRRARPLVADPD